MRKPLMQIGLAALLTGALAGYGPALAQDDFGEEELGEEDFDDDFDDDFGEPEPEPEPAAEETADEMAAAEGGSRLVLPQGGIFVYAPLEINLSDGSEFEPTSLAPDVWYGVTPELTAGLVHSTRGTSGFFGIGGRNAVSGQGAGICFTGDEGGCDKFYNNLGFEGRYLFKDDGPLELAANGGLFLTTLDPFALALKAGLLGRWTSGQIAVEFNPNLFIGLTERDPAMMGSLGNKTWLNVPVKAKYMLNEQLSLYGQTGIAGPIEEVGMAGFGDLFNVPLTVGASYSVSRQLAVGGAFTLPVLLGGDFYDAFGIDGFDGRTLTLYATWRQ